MFDSLGLDVGSSRLPMQVQKVRQAQQLEMQQLRLDRFKDLCNVRDPVAAKAVRSPLDDTEVFSSNILFDVLALEGTCQARLQKRRQKLCAKASKAASGKCRLPPGLEDFAASLLKAATSSETGSSTTQLSLPSLEYHNDHALWEEELFRGED